MPFKVLLTVKTLQVGNLHFFFFHFKISPDLLFSRDLMLRSQVVQAEISAFMYKYQFGRRVKKVWDDKEILYPKEIKKKKN